MWTHLQFSTQSSNGCQCVLCNFQWFLFSIMSVTVLFLGWGAFPMIQFTLFVAGICNPIVIRLVKLVSPTVKGYAGRYLTVVINCTASTVWFLSARCLDQSCPTRIHRRRCWKLGWWCPFRSRCRSCCTRIRRRTYSRSCHSLTDRCRCRGC